MGRVPLLATLNFICKHIRVCQSEEHFFLVDALGEIVERRIHSRYCLARQLMRPVHACVRLVVHARVLAACPLVFAVVCYKLLVRAGEFMARGAFYM